MEEISTVNNIVSENIDFSMFALFMSADYVNACVFITFLLISVLNFYVMFFSWEDYKYNLRRSNG